MLVAKKLKLKGNKSKPKRQRTFTSSELSLPCDRTHQSLSELFRNDAFKRRPPPPSAPTAVPKKQASQKQLNVTKKRTKSKSKARLDRCETYEVIPYKNSFKSNIVFSNQDTKREGWTDPHIPLNEKYLPNNNQQLRISIRREYLRKVEAAVKIQKVFRGFLTRKVLQRYMEKEQRTIHHQRLTQTKSRQASGAVSEHSSYFAERENSGDSPRRRDEQPPPIYDDDSSSSEGGVVYRHHEAIYSQEEIGDFGSSEEEDFNQDAFDGHIIFETNEEYIDSRKSSQQPQPRNKLSTHNAHPIVEEEDTQGEALVKTEKKQEWAKSEGEEIREVTLKLNQESRVRQLGMEGEATMKGAMEGQVQRLKEEQVSRWEEVIGLVQSQLGREDPHFSSFMQQLMHLSLKNKQLLEIGSPKKEPSLTRLDSKGKLKALRAERLYLYIDEPSKCQDHFEEISAPSVEKVFGETKEDAPQQIVAGEKIGPMSCFQSSAHLKRLLAEPTDSHVQEMLQLREDLLKKREVEEMRRLNLDLEGKAITQQAFLDRLQHIQQKYAQEKTSIERTREDIIRGHKAAQRLTQQAVTDAKKLGYDLPLSRSAGGLRCKRPLPHDLLIIDELSNSRREDRPRQMPKPPLLYPEEGIHISLSSDAESSDLDFNEDEMWRLRRAQPDLELASEIADLGRNVMISEELLRQQQAEENQLMMTQHVSREVTQHRREMGQQVSREVYEIEESSPPACSPQVAQLTDWLSAVVLWEAVGELLLKPLFAERLLEKSQLVKPTAVTDQERLHFLSLLEKHFPPADALNSKLNQKICPLPSELLRCMRIDFSEEDDENSYEEIGKYEFIIGQDVCNQAIQEFRAGVEAAAPVAVAAMEELVQLGREFCFSQKLGRYALQREKYSCNRRNHTRQLRWEVLNIEVHCIFDAWNEELIALRSEKPGYSGIGLNELTLAVHDHNSRIPTHRTLPVIAQGKQRLIRTMSLSSPGLVFPAVVEEEEEAVETDSRWIFYADEALSYGLQLVYLVEEDLFNEVAKELRKRILLFA